MLYAEHKSHCKKVHMIPLQACPKVCLYHMMTIRCGKTTDYSHQINRLQLLTIMIEFMKGNRRASLSLIRWQRSGIRCSKTSVFHTVQLSLLMAPVCSQLLRKLRISCWSKCTLVLREWDEKMPVQNCWLREKEDE